MTGDIQLYFRNIKDVAKVTSQGHEGQFHVGVPVAVFFMTSVMMHKKIDQVAFAVGHKLLVMLNKKGDFQKLAKFSVRKQVGTQEQYGKDFPHRCKDKQVLWIPGYLKRRISRHNWGFNRKIGENVGVKEDSVLYL